MYFSQLSLMVSIVAVFAQFYLFLRIRQVIKTTRRSNLCKLLLTGAVGLTIASLVYGPMLGAFLLGVLTICAGIALLTGAVAWSTLCRARAPHSTCATGRAAAAAAPRATAG